LQQHTFLQYECGEHRPPPPFPTRALPIYARLWQDGGWTGAAPEGRIIVNGLHPDEWRLWCAYRGLPEAIGRRTTELASFDLVLQDRKSTRLNSSHVKISYAVFCLNKKRHR